MSDRWKMNRIGFVNFWLYDEEDFEFVDGKLLLRGQNGSGKSITTQSFIPFVLDGDRTLVLEYNHRHEMLNKLYL